MRPFTNVAFVILAVAAGCSGGDTQSASNGGGVGSGPCPETSCEPHATTPGAFTGTTDCGCGMWHCTCGADMRWHECCCPEYFSEDPACSE